MNPTLILHLVRANATRAQRKPRLRFA